MTITMEVFIVKVATHHNVICEVFVSSSVEKLSSSTLESHCPGGPLCTSLYL